ncbi:class I adenylate-forming enzyme family protein [Novosphingobium sp.]|uniref:class I adenylate-forming enzyme family protein n=1 Tax=Novosphingobium sp. TaxID=1874826 RepID=UPI00261D3D2A|nr:class I adenylate-forming enzyme family protein [Novosphingobium sp.]
MAGDVPETQPDFRATIPGMLHAVAARYAEYPAVCKDAITISYRGLEAQSAELARGLLALGVGKGDRVGILLPNGPEFVVIFLAATRIGAVAAPLSTLYQGAELRWVLEHAAIRWLVTAGVFRSHDYLARLESALPGLAGQDAEAGALAVSGAPFLRGVFVPGETDRRWARSLFDAAAAALAARPQFDAEFLSAVEAQIAPADPVCIIHTSGSTAHPKGVIHGHGPFIRHTYQMAKDFTPLGPGDRVVALRPFFWVAGLAAQLFYCLQAGACHITIDSPSEEALLRAIREQGMNMIAGDESWYQNLRRSAGLRDAGFEMVELSVEFGGVAQQDADGRLQFLSPNLAARLPRPEHFDIERFPWTFGMTEFLGAHTSLPFGEHTPADRPRVGGRPVPGVRARICDPETHVTLPPGTPGELEVRGYSMMLGMDGRERGELFTDDGYYRTDDLATMDADGYVTLIGRLGDGFKVKGANVAPLEVELALYGFSQIERCCVLGIPLDKSRTDHLVVAVVQPSAGSTIDEAAILAGLKANLSSYKVPHHIMVFAPEDIPITGSGKVKRSKLQELVAERLALHG